MSRRQKINVHIGYKVGSGDAVAIDLAHIFVTGQTQVSGKTTTLQAIVERSGCRALAFVTKRGEELAGRVIRPYLPREGDEPIHWRFVETIIASALGQRAMKYERLQIINAAKDAYSLDDVRRNAAKLQAKAKGPAGDIYMLLGEYLDLVLPEMRALKASDTLDLQPGLNVMDVTEASADLQALVIGAAMQRINDEEKNVLTVFPEAWQFAPRDRNTAAKFHAEKMARMGAAIGNFLLCDSQDIAGVSPVVRQASTVWIIGVQREANELKRTLGVIKSSGVAAPKPSEVATLQIGQFFVCQGSRAIKTYVQPTWMTGEQARAVAMGGDMPASLDRPASPPAAHPNLDDEPDEYARAAKLHEALAEDESVPFTEAEFQPADPAQPEDDMPDQVLHDKFDQLIDLLSRRKPPLPVTATATRENTPVPSASLPVPWAEAGGEEGMYQRFKARLLAEVPAIAAGGPITLLAPDKLRDDFQREEADRIIASAKALRALPMRVLKLVETTDDFITQPTITKRLGRSDGGGPRADLARAVKELTEIGFVESRQGNGVRKALRAKIASDLAFYKATEAQIDAVYQTVMNHVATGAERD